MSREDRLLDALTERFGGFESLAPISSREMLERILHDLCHVAYSARWELLHLPDPHLWNAVERRIDALCENMREVEGIDALRLMECRVTAAELRLYARLGLAVPQNHVLQVQATTFRCKPEEFYPGVEEARRRYPDHTEGLAEVVAALIAGVFRHHQRNTPRAAHLTPFDGI